MSKISQIFDGFESLVSTTFPSHKKLVNPYDLEQGNDSLALNRGVGFYLGPANNTNRQIGCFLSIQRDVVFVLSIANRGTDRDVSIRQSAEKQILEDLITLIKATEEDPNLNELASKVLYQSDEGLQLFVNQYNYLVIQARFQIEYIEEI